MGTMDIPAIDQPNRIYIPVNCTESWELMPGDDKVRFCGKCCHNVYNFVGMSYAEQNAILSKGGSLPCIRAYLRRDRTVVLDRCPVVLRAFRDKVKRCCAITVVLLSTWCHNAIALASGQPTRATPAIEEEGTGFGGGTIEPGSQTVRSIVSVQDYDISEIATNLQQPTLSYLGTCRTHEKWRLQIYGPVRWSDRAGFLHEAKCQTGDWRNWLDAIGPKIVKRWQNRMPSETKFVAEVTLHDKLPGTVLKFEPPWDAALLKEIIQDLTGLSKGKELANVLPAEAKDAEFVFLKLRLQKIEK